MATNAANSDIPKAPSGTGPAGRKLWRSVVEKYELEEWEMAILRELVRTVDQLDELAAIVATEGMMAPGPGLTTRVHPALTEARQLRLAMARLSASLRMPVGKEGDQPSHLRRPQRRGGARGTYGLRVVA